MTNVPGSDEAAASGGASEERATAGQPLLSVRVEHVDGAFTVGLGGELDVSTAPQLHEVLLDAVSQQPSGPIILDLSALTFVDSTGLSLLVSTHKRMNGVGRALVLRGAQPTVRRLLEVTGLTDVFRMET